MVINDLPIYGYLVTVAEFQSLLFGVMDSKQGLSGKFINIELGWLYFRSRYRTSVIILWSRRYAYYVIDLKSPVTLYHDQ